MKIKNVLLSVVLLTCTLFIFTDCTEKIEQPSTDSIVRFLPIIKSSTKSETKLLYGVWAFQLPLDLSWENNAAKATPIMTNEKIEFTNNGWKTSTPYLWTYSNKLSFFAYSPYSYPAKFTIEEGIIFNDYSIESDLDLMYSSAVTDQLISSSFGTVNLPMYDALSKAKIYLFADFHEDSSISISKVTIDGFWTKGSFHSLPEPSWTYQGEKEKLTIDTKNVSLQGGRSMIATSFDAIPQNVKLKVSVEGTFYANAQADGEPFALESSLIALLGIGQTKTFTIYFDGANGFYVDDKKYYYD